MMHSAPTSPGPSRLTILRAIGDALGNYIQWQEGASVYAAHRASAYIARAECLIELLEAHDCGSVGGFDKGQPESQSLFERWVWLYKKYDSPKGERFQCQIRSFKDQERFFNQ